MGSLMTKQLAGDPSAVQRAWRWAPSQNMLAARDAVAAAFGFDAGEYENRRPFAASVPMRLATAWVLRRRYPNLSAVQLGRLIGRDHSTILHALKRAEDLREQDADYRALTDGLIS